MKKSWVRGAMLLASAAFLGGGAAQAAGTLTVGMTAGDLPVTTGNPDQGFEGYRFVGYNLYDSLVLWDLVRRTRANRATVARPNGKPRVTRLPAASDHGREQRSRQ